ncbi:ParA family protein (plasmid) [Borrelia sp. CA_690]|uniref:ParA family protein n=1 Tax=Borrelia maritima TaxID=2761123 RepID=A0A5J6WE08_9SPIR|nr:ParA family protein [Borrelia maritima]QFI15027.1 ParA family protein [Borrelia maritima]
MDRKKLAKKPNIIAVASIKGGVGKSTSSIMFSAILNKTNKVLLIDLDPQNAVTSYFITQDHPRMELINIYNSYSLMKKDKTFKDIVINVSKNLDFIPSYLELAKFSKEGNQFKELMLRNAVYNYLEDYDYVIIDTPPSLSAELDNALVIADKVVIPVPLERWAVENLPLLINQIKELENNFIGKETKIIHIFASKVEIGRVASTEIMALLKEKYLNKFIGEVHKSEALKRVIDYAVEPKENENYYREYLKILEKI